MTVDLCAQVVWSCSDRSLLLWCAHSGAYLGALLHDRDTDALFNDLELPSAAVVPPALAEREERRHFIDASKACLPSSMLGSLHNKCVQVGQHATQR